MEAMTNTDEVASIEPSKTASASDYWSSGRIRYAFSFFLFFSWLLWNVSVFHCTFLSLRIKNLVGDSVAVAELGLFHRAEYGALTVPLSYVTNGEEGGAAPDSYFDFLDDDSYLSTRKRFICVAYHPDTVDQFAGAEHASRAFGVIGYICTTLALLLVFLVELVVSQTQRAKQMWLVTRILLIVSLISSLCIFSIFGSDFCQKGRFFECTISSTGVAAIINVFVLMAVVSLSWLVQIPTEGPIVGIRFWRKSDNGAADPKQQQESADDNNTHDPQNNIEDSPSAFRYAYLGLIFLTWLFWNIGVFHCTFVALGFESTSYGDREQVYGLFSKALREDIYKGNIYSCSAYTFGERTEIMDAAFQAARFFGGFGYFIHSCVLLLVSLMELVMHPPMRERLWTGARVLVVVSFLCSLLIFTMFGTNLCTSDDDYLEKIKCVPYAAGIIAIWNILLMLGLVVVSWFIPAPDHPIFHVSLM